MLLRGVFQFEVQLDNWLLSERKKELTEEGQTSLLDN